MATLFIFDILAKYVRPLRFLPFFVTFCCVWFTPTRAATPPKKFEIPSCAGDLKDKVKPYLREVLNQGLLKDYDLRSYLKNVRAGTRPKPKSHFPLNIVIRLGGENIPDLNDELSKLNWNNWGNLTKGRPLMENYYIDDDVITIVKFADLSVIELLEHMPEIQSMDLTRQTKASLENRPWKSSDRLHDYLSLMLPNERMNFEIICKKKELEACITEDTEVLSHRLEGNHLRVVVNATAVEIDILSEHPDIFSVEPNPLHP